jgi:hypothetical protein
MGNKLIDPSRFLDARDPGATPLPDLTQVPQSAYGSMTTGGFPSWHLGLEFKMPFGFRREMAGVRFAQLNLTREHKILQEQELELSHKLADAFRALSENYNVSQTNYNRWLAAEREVQAVQAAYDVGTTTLDQVLDAQRRKAEAANEYYRTLVQYSLSITQVHLWKGSLLEYDGVFLAEGPWPAKAYFDARRRARHRDASHYINYGFTQPRIVSQGPYEQGAGQMAADEDAPMEAPLPAGQAAPMGPEEVQPLKPLPMKQGSTAGGKPNADQHLQFAPEPGAGGQTSRVGNAHPTAYDLAQMNLRELGSAKVQGQAAMPRLTAAITQASHQQGEPASGQAVATDSSATWKSTIRSGKTEEPSASPSPAPANSSASGWKSVRR